MLSGNKNLFKYREIDKFLKKNDICVFIETGCTTKPPKLFSPKWTVAQNNMIDDRSNAKYIHNGKGTAVLKRKSINT